MFNCPVCKVSLEVGSRLDVGRHLRVHIRTLDYPVSLAEKWQKIEKTLATEILRKHGDFLVPLENLTLADAVISYENPLFDLKTANDRTLAVFLSLPVLFPPRPCRASKGTTLPKLDIISQKLVRRFPEGTNLAEALQQAETDGMIQPGLVVIGDRRYVKADLIPIKITSSSAADSISIVFALFHVFNLSFPEHLNLVYNFLQNVVDFERDSDASEPSKKKKRSSKSLVVNDLSFRILQVLSNQGPSNSK